MVIVRKWHVVDTFLTVWVIKVVLFEPSCVQINPTLRIYNAVFWALYAAAFVRTGDSSHFMKREVFVLR
jgi:hypothetical protein